MSRLAVWTACLAALLVLAPTSSPLSAQQTKLPQDEEAEQDPYAHLRDVDEAAEETSSSEEDPDAGEEEEEGEPPERIRFDVPFPEEDGGGVARGSAGALEYVTQDYVVATDGVELAFEAFVFQAERVEVDLKTKDVVAIGSVVLDEGPRRLSGQRLEFNLDSKTGTMYEGEAFVDPDLFFSGSEIEKIGEDLYTVKNGMITSCSEDKTPDWSFRLGRGVIKVNGFARIRNTRFQAKKLPFLYSPYLVFPTNQSRKSGLLMPNIGHNSIRGSFVGLAYFQTLGPSYDATLYTDVYDDNFLGAGLEFRYTPVVGTQGLFNGYAIKDTNATDASMSEWRWKAFLEQRSDGLPGGMRGVIKVREYSDFEFFRDFERSFNQISLRQVDSTGFLSGNWGSHSFNLLLQNREVFISAGQVVEQQQLPEIEYKLRSTRLGNLPLYLGLASSAHYFSVRRSDIFDEAYGRFDIAPSLTVPLSFAPWMSISATLGGRATYWENSLTPTGDTFSGESLTRVLPSASAQIVGPSFSKIFDKQIGRFGKFKHIIEPRVGYRFLDDFDEQTQVPLFDEIDTFSKRNLVGVSLVHRLLAKPADEESSEGTREIMSFELSKSFSLNQDQPLQRNMDGIESRSGPITGRFRFTNGRRMNVESRFEYSSFLGGFRSASLSGGTDLKRAALSMTWFARFDPENSTTTSHQARLASRVAIVPARLNLDSYLNYDVRSGLMQQQRYIITYNSQCWSAIFEYRDARSFSRRQKDYRLSINLKNIGSFLDLNTGSREIY